MALNAVSPGRKDLVRSQRKDLRERLIRIHPSMMGGALLRQKTETGFQWGINGGAGNGFNIRRASYEDIDEIVELHRTMYKGLGHEPGLVLDHACDELEHYLGPAIKSNIWRSFVAEARAKEIFGFIAVTIQNQPPMPSNLSGKVGYITAYHVDHDYAAIGAERGLLECTFAMLKQDDVNRISVHATGASEFDNLWEEFDFKQTDEIQASIV